MAADFSCYFICEKFFDIDEFQDGDDRVPDESYLTHSDLLR